MEVIAVPILIDYDTEGGHRQGCGRRNRLLTAMLEMCSDSLLKTCKLDKTMFLS
jgi:hypothetical protein